MSSSSSSSSKSLYQGSTFDVFLSYHDKDIGKSFALDLYSALTQAGYVVFVNDHGGQRNSAAIKASRTSIIIFSSKFDGSTRFLDQLEMILECRRTIKQVVVPVFFDVDPSDVQNQKGVFGKAIARSIFKKGKSIRYRDALCQAATISDFWMINFRSQSKDINDIVQGLSRLIEDQQLLFIAEHPVGVEARVKDVIQLLNSGQPENTMIVGIWGMDGVGKTTIAKATYNQMGRTFEGKSFLHSVNEIWEQGIDELVSLQQQLLSDICKTTNMHISTVASGITILRKRLHHKKIFLVLDGVNKWEQLDALCGSCQWFGHGSRIVITTSDKHILGRLQVDHVYRMNYMDNTESLELFSWHAFKNPSPIESYTDLCRDVVEYCGGLPLALEVIGSYLFQRSVEEWKNVLEKLKTIPHDHILNKLRTNLDGLDRQDIDVFLKIATLFIGMQKDDVIQTLNDSGHFSELAISVLKDKSLVTIDSDNRIGMHTLVRAMGREIIREEGMGMAATKMYDVFLSFRGEDCRAKFISHLYSSLQNSGLYVFKDDDGIQRGDKISVALMEAVGQSKISIVVLSRNFANSKWCMVELERIVEISRTKGMVVVPVFYEVDPSEVRNQTGEFGESFQYLVSKISVDEYTKRNWKTALHEIGGIGGVVILKSR